MIEDGNPNNSNLMTNKNGQLLLTGPPLREDRQRVQYQNKIEGSPPVKKAKKTYGMFYAANETRNK
jgi:hypothetical protein